MSWTETVSLHINDEDNEQFMEQTINSIFNLFSCLIIGVIACMPFVFPIMVNRQYDDAYYQIPILMVSILFQIVVGLYSVIYVALKKSVEIAKTSFYAAVINVVVDVLFVRFIGLYAASISTLVAYVTMAVYRYFHVKKYVNIPLKSSTIVFTTIIATITVATYYYRNWVMCLISLIIVVIYSFLVNIELIKRIMNTLFSHIKKRRNG